MSVAVPHSGHNLHELDVCVFITAGPMTKLCAWGRRIVEDMCYEIRRAEACVGLSADHALVNAGEKEIV